MKLLAYLERRSMTFLMVLGFLLVVLLGILNFYAGPNVSLLIFYLLPIFLAAWFVSHWAGVGMTLFSGASWLIIAWVVPGHFSNPAIPFWNAVMSFGFILITSILVSNFRRSLDHERELARTDFLTGAVNNRSFRELAEAEINRAQRNHHPFTVAYMDVDDFKLVNDRLGHTTGDALLREMAEVIKMHVRAFDVVARLGGDEFSILLPETSHEAARIVVERVRTSLLYVMKKNKWPVTFSIGVVTWDQPPRTVDDMLRITDGLMYVAKNHGKNMILHRVASEMSESASAA